MKQDKKEELRKRIVETARENFARDGFKNVKTDHLANEIGISKRTLYNIIPSKEKLFEEVILAEFERLSIEIDEIIDRILHDEKSDIIAELKKIWDVTAFTSIFYTKEFFADIRKYMPEIWKKILDFRRIKMKEHFFKIVDTGVKRGVFKPHLKYDLIYHVHRAITDGIMVPEVMVEIPYTPKEAMGVIYELLFTGALTENARGKYHCDCVIN